MLYCICFFYLKQLSMCHVIFAFGRVIFYFAYSWAFLLNALTKVILCKENKFVVSVISFVLIEPATYFGLGFVKIMKIIIKAFLLLIYCLCFYPFEFWSIELKMRLTYLAELPWNCQTFKLMNWKITLNIRLFYTKKVISFMILFSFYNMLQLCFKKTWS